MSARSLVAILGLMGVVAGVGHGSLRLPARGTAWMFGSDLAQM